MNATAPDIVRALVDLSKTVPNGEKLLREVRDLLSRQMRGGGTLNVTLMTTSGDETALASAVSAMIAQKTGKDVTLTQSKNPQLIGGAVLKIGDEQIDLSVRGALNDIESQLKASPVSA